MIIGIGVDMVYIPEISRYQDQAGDSFFVHTFTDAERKGAERIPDSQKATYFAGLFASKEAAFKALGHHSKEKVWDFRCVETLHHEDGAPYIHPTEELKQHMEEAGVTELLVSITNEKDYAQAFVLAQR